MKKINILPVILLFSIICHGQATIKLEDAGQHAGDSVIVCGKVSGTRWLEQSKDSPTFINMGAAYPHQLLTIVIWKEVRSSFESAPEILLKGKLICVTGKIELYKDKPQIVIHNREQITVQ